MEAAALEGPTAARASTAIIRHGTKDSDTLLAGVGYTGQTQANIIFTFMKHFFEW